MRTLTLTLACLLGGCSLIPQYQRPAAPVPAQYPQGGVYTSAVTTDWQPLFHEPALQQLIADALRNNRDLRVAAQSALASVSVGRSL